MSRSLGGHYATCCSYSQVLGRKTKGKRVRETPLWTDSQGSPHPQPTPEGRHLHGGRRFQFPSSFLILLGQFLFHSPFRISDAIQSDSPLFQKLRTVSSNALNFFFFFNFPGDSRRTWSLCSTRAASFLPVRVPSEAVLCLDPQLPEISLVWEGLGVGGLRRQVTK